MPYRSVPTAKFRKWLRSKGLVYVRSRGGHELWDFPDDSLPRPIVFRSAAKDIPAFHIGTNLDTLGISKKDFYDEINGI